MSNRLAELLVRREYLRTARDRMHDTLSVTQHELRDVELEINRLKHECPCVALNKDLDIHDMTEQIRRGRVGLGYGLVSETLSASKFCPKCEGTGKLVNNSPASPVEPSRP
jgi:hypothetical protein